MTRGYRILTSVHSSENTAAAEPPEAVNVESDFVVILAALLCALICVVGLIAVARCAWLRRGGDGGGGNTTGRRTSNQPSANKGLKKKILEALPKFTYDGKAGGDCAICLAEYVTGDEIRVLPQCGHRFHVGCIDLWLCSHSSCPSCRQILVVTRCKKCGEFPTVNSSSGSTTGEVTPSSAPAAEEVAAKGGGRRQDSCSAASSSDYLP